MTIGRYQITREIARSNDIVYEAFDPQLGRKLALIFHHLVSHSDFSRQGWSQVGI